ncbi:G-type lectin S-receptor-like serine/threonine-protein kinase [Actinidia chinensis var. chinensis]|uniref:Receptor-like serine/threonine-protein kinase n=1 Tax=Actinidia chinensis var. chinensis TaxID=1590841 RepID=A0A2R6QWB9_ACTCC|nr:G-type lectin S-receptor-like serine/threonine-protein kinase [Actinidia chinensis var. chinensis]
MDEHGNLVLSDTSGNSYFSTGLQGRLNSSRSMKLLDSGNLVLTDDSSEKSQWESFDHPTDTFLPGMKMYKNLNLTSQTSDDDPRSGSYSLKQHEDDNRTFVIWKTYNMHWISGEADEFNSYTEMPKGVEAMLANFSKLIGGSPRSFVPSGNMPYISYSNNFTSSVSEYKYTRIVMNSSGVLQFWNMNSLTWFAPADVCSMYNHCGNFESCNSKTSPPCKCFLGFKPSSPDSSEDNSAGCTRKSEIMKNDTFLSLKMMRVGKPDLLIESAKNETSCREECLKNLKCLAYSYVKPSINPQVRTDTCWIWTTDLSNLEEHVVGGHDLYVRIAASDIAESMQGSQSICMYDTERRVKNLIDTGEFKEEDKKGIDVPFFDLESILEATDYFSDANKLGQGGFGHVYKGTFGGQEIAVKRLSSHSGQGLEEFKNEVVLIAKLQHRNLVRLQGYCIKGDEKILLYEYMRNKSLDAFIFDRTRCLLLDWEKRFDIITGIARGLLYLHQDSRLRIIHRDLKTGNILLDDEMNPKISDFGLARIVGGKETEANTTRVVGTYGYMSPEYALEGLFSVKSDVFSFGVIVLEIVSGKRNTGFYQSHQGMNLLSYAWRLWKEEKALDLMDLTLRESCNRCEVLKCIIVGLLCVQEDPSHRPNMSNVVFMLGSETVTLPNPKEPAFVARKWISTQPSTSSSKPDTCSVSGMTITAEEGR